jgi:hypothetical protein
MNDKRDEDDDDVTRRLTLRNPKFCWHLIWNLFYVHEKKFAFNLTISSFLYLKPFKFSNQFKLVIILFQTFSFYRLFLSKKVCRASNNQALSSRNWVCIKYLEGLVGRASEFVVDSLLCVVKRDPFSRLVKLFVGLWKSTIKPDYETRLEAP